MKTSDDLSNFCKQRQDEYKDYLECIWSILHAIKPLNVLLYIIDYNLMTHCDYTEIYQCISIVGIFKNLLHKCAPEYDNKDPLL